MSASVTKIDPDRGWFRRHPDRQYRVRPLIAGELLPSEEQALPTVKMFVALRRGDDLKVFFRGESAPCSCETCAGRFWRVLQLPFDGPIAIAAPLADQP